MVVLKAVQMLELLIFKKKNCVTSQNFNRSSENNICLQKEINCKDMK